MPGRRSKAHQRSMRPPPAAIVFRLILPRYKRSIRICSTFSSWMYSSVARTILSLIPCSDGIPCREDQLVLLSLLPPLLRLILFIFGRLTQKVPRMAVGD